MNARLSNEPVVGSHEIGAVNSLAAFKAIPSGAAVGAEILGVNLALPVPEDVQNALRKAWADHMILVFRGQDVDFHPKLSHFRG